MPEKPGGRRSRGTWTHSVYLLLVFGGLLSAPNNDVEHRHRQPQVVE